MQVDIALIVGLGNPGNAYEETRHNAGWWLLDKLAQSYGGKFQSESKFFGDVAKISVAGKTCWLLKPTTFMNRSGQAVTALSSFYKIPPQSIVVAHDELDLPPGVARLKQSGGHGGHNGLRSIMSSLGNGEFLRLRIGIGHPGNKDQVTDYVLHRPSQEHQALIDISIAEAADVLPLLLDGDLQRAMHRLHSAQ